MDAGVNAGARGRTKVSLRDVTIVRDETDDGVRVMSRKRPEVCGGLKEG